VLNATGIFGHYLSQRQVHLLYMSFVKQLEDSGLYGWAVYVASLLPSEACRKRAVSDLVNRHIWRMSEAELGLLNRIKLGGQILALGKAFKAKYDGDLKSEVYNLSLAREWSAWRTMMTESLGPLLIKNGDLAAFSNFVKGARSLGYNHQRDDGTLGLFIAYLDAIQFMEGVKVTPSVQGSIVRAY